jgi:hypothetical protein
MTWYPKQQRHEDLCHRCKVASVRETINLGIDLEEAHILETIKEAINSVPE